MTRTVTEGAVMLGGMVGVDPLITATADSETHLPPGRDYTPLLRSGGLLGHGSATTRATVPAVTGALLRFGYDYEQRTLRRVPPSTVNPGLFPNGCTPPETQAA